MDTPSKQCTKCNEVKPLTDFHKDRTKPDGHVSQCKSCKCPDYYTRLSFIPDGMKMCVTCQQIKPLNVFCKSKRSEDGYAGQCKSCKNHRERERTKETPRKVYPRLSPDEADVAMETCSKCGQTKSLREFTTRNNALGGYAKVCKVCRNAYARNRTKLGLISKYVIRKSRLKTIFNMTLEEYESMYEAQDGLCAICGKPETSFDPRQGVFRKLCVDHCHTTGQVRALLCARCNLTFGKLDEDPMLIEAMLRYARKWESIKNERTG